MKLNACRITATIAPHSLLTNQSPEFSGDTPPDKNKSFVQIDQATAFQLLRDLDPSDFKVFFFLTMRAYGWDDKTHRVGDGVTRASGTFVAKGTGLSEATSERCINTLKEKELISKHHHSCKWGNTYVVKPALLRQTLADGKVQVDQKQNRKSKEPKPEEPELAQLIAQPEKSQPEPVVTQAQLDQISEKLLTEMRERDRNDEVKIITLQDEMDKDERNHETH